MKVFRCREVSPMYCPFELRGETKQGIVEQISVHGKAEHGLTDEMIMPAMIAVWEAHIREEPDGR